MDGSYKDNDRLHVNLEVMCQNQHIAQLTYRRLSDQVV